MGGAVAGLREPGDFGERPTAEGARLAKEAANNALANDPDNVMAMGSLARVAADFEFDLQAAARFHQRALELEPGNLVSLNAAATMFLFIGRLDEARRLFEYRLAHDPANPTAHYNMAIVLYSARQWDAAIDEFRTTLRLSPEVAWCPQRRRARASGRQTGRCCRPEGGRGRAG
jgi:tetratricopeptide (TPR) repeat protein